MTTVGDGAGAADPAFPDAVIVLAGGEGRRLGGVDKAALRVGGRTLLQRVLAAAAGRPTVVVGPARQVPPGVRSAREDPPGGGPAAGVAAGFAALEPLMPAVEQAAPGPGSGSGSAAGCRSGSGPGPASGRVGRAADRAAGGDALVAILAVDQPGITPATLARLAAAVPAGSRTLGAVLVSGGRRQYAAGVFPAAALRAALAGRPGWHGVALRLLVDPLVGAEVPAGEREAGDVDTPADLARWRAADPG